MDFVTSQRGKNKLLHADFIYEREKTKGKNTYWKCEQRKICNGRAVTDNKLKVRKIKDHTHAPPHHKEATIPQTSQERRKNELLHAGYIYKYERTRENITYWVCDQRSCNGRACDERSCNGWAVSVNNGDTAKVRTTKDHTHAPPRQEKATIFQNSQRRKNKLLHEGYTYARDKMRGNKSYWRCDKKQSCNARAVSINNKVRKTRDHTHARKKKATLKRKSSPKPRKKKQVETPKVQDRQVKNPVKVKKTAPFTSSESSFKQDRSDCTIL